MFIIAMRAAIWTFQTEPCFRLQYSRGQHSSFASQIAKKHVPGTSRLSRVAMDALNLICNLRGIGWNWSKAKGLYIPTETRPVHSRIKFLLFTLLSAFSCAITLDIFRVCVQSFSPTKFCSPQEDDNTIFDHTLPPLQRYLLPLSRGRMCIANAFDARGGDRELVRRCRDDRREIETGKEGEPRRRVAGVSLRVGPRAESANFEVGVSFGKGAGDREGRARRPMRRGVRSCRLCTELRASLDELHRSPSVSFARIHLRLQLHLV